MIVVMEQMIILCLAKDARRCVQASQSVLPWIPSSSRVATGTTFAQMIVFLLQVMNS